MGPKKTRLTRAVLDTNVFVPAVLFKGTVSALLNHWKEKKFAFLISKEILEEYVHVLSYPKFKLTEPEIYSILNHHLLPYVTPVKVAEGKPFPVRDIMDSPFIRCANDSETDFLVTGDRDLLEYPSPLKTKQGRVSIVTPHRFLEILAAG